MLVAQMMRFGSESAQRGYADGRYWRNQPMMDWTNNRAGIWLFELAHLVIFILVVAVLIALIRLLWFKGNREKKSR